MTTMTTTTTRLMTTTTGLTATGNQRVSKRTSDRWKVPTQREEPSPTSGRRPAVGENAVRACIAYSIIPARRARVASSHRRLFASSIHSWHPLSQISRMVSGPMMSATTSDSPSSMPRNSSRVMSCRAVSSSVQASDQSISRTRPARSTTQLRALMSRCRTPTACTARYAARMRGLCVSVWQCNRTRLDSADEGQQSSGWRARRTRGWSLSPSLLESGRRVADGVSGPRSYRRENGDTTREGEGTRLGEWKSETTGRWDSTVLVRRWQQEGGSCARRRPTARSRPAGRPSGGGTEVS